MNRKRRDYEFATLSIYSNDLTRTIWNDLSQMPLAKCAGSLQCGTLNLESAANELIAVHQIPFSDDAQLERQLRGRIAVDLLQAEVKFSTLNLKIIKRNTMVCSVVCKPLVWLTNQYDNRDSF